MAAVADFVWSRRGYLIFEEMGVTPHNAVRHGGHEWVG